MSAQLDFIALLEGWIAPFRPAPAASEKSSVISSSPGISLPASDPLLEKLARDLLTGIGCARLAQQVQVRWHPRLRTTAGQAYYAKSLVLLNPKLRQFGAEEVEKTLRHELAHLVARFRSGRRRISPHGAEWRAACQELGLPGENRCHNLPLPRSRQRIRHLYRCPRCKKDHPRVRPFRRKVACLACCRAHAHGAYDERFRLVKVPL